MQDSGDKHKREHCLVVAEVLLVLQALLLCPSGRPLPLLQPFVEGTENPS